MDKSGRSPCPQIREWQWHPGFLQKLLTWSDATLDLLHVIIGRNVAKNETTTEISKAKMERDGWKDWKREREKLQKHSLTPVPSHARQGVHSRLFSLSVTEFFSPKANVSIFCSYISPYATRRIAKIGIYIIFNRVCIHFTMLFSHDWLNNLGFLSFYVFISFIIVNKYQQRQFNSTIFSLVVTIIRMSTCIYNIA